MIDRDSVIASVVGAMTAAFFLKKDTVPRRIGMAIGGLALAYVLGPWLVTIFPNTTLPVFSVVISMFGMAIASGIYAVLDAFNASEFLAKLYKRIGLGD